MRTKLFGGFVAALAIAAFAVLPAAASAAPATIRSRTSTIVATSGNLTFTSSGGQIACTESELTGEITGEGQITLNNEGTFEGGGTMEAGGVELCPDNGTGGRVEASVRHVAFTPLNLRTGNPITGNIANAGFEIALWDRNIIPNAPIAECRYEGEVNTTTEPRTDEINIAGQVAGLAASRGPLSICPEAGELNGDFRVQDTATPPMPVIFH